MPSFRATDQTDGLMRGSKYSLTWAEVYRELTAKIGATWR